MVSEKFIARMFVGFALKRALKSMPFRRGTLFSTLLITVMGPTPSGFQRVTISESSDPPALHATHHVASLAKKLLLERFGA
jgi:hypothetical protein